MANLKKTNLPFKPKAKLLLELGNQLIKDEGIALFELVKNAYDADATKVNISLSEINNAKGAKIIIEDNGSGMTSEIIKKVWLEPGTDYKKKQIAKGYRTPKYHRVPLGEKGIGRFGVHKLGKKIELITKNKNDNEIVVTIDWEEFENDKYLDDIPVQVVERSPLVFKSGKTGTIITITDLWQSWNRGMVRDIYRAVNSISSPFKSPEAFKTELILNDPDKKDWLEGLISWKDAFKFSLFKAKYTIEGSELNYEYEFTPWEALNKIKGRKIKSAVPIRITDFENKNKTEIDLSQFKIGKVVVDLNIYDLDVNVLAMGGVSDKLGLKEFLKNNGGLRVYRNNLRVYDYGEPGNDWLELGVRRVNIPTARISNNLIIGAVSLDRSKSTDLVEKTNREGFIENEAVKALRKAVIFGLVQIENERNVDKERLRVAYSTTPNREPVLDDINELRTKLKAEKLLDKYDKYLVKVENNFIDVRDKLLTSAGAGLSLSIVIHEIEKIINELKIVVKKESKSTRLKTLIEHLSELTQGYAALLRGNGKQVTKAGELIKQAEFNVNYRLAAHDIKFINGTSKNNDFSLTCSKRLIIGAIMNLFDNSIWWLENKKPQKKYIYISTSKELKDGPAIIIGDNGPGVIDPIQYITLPFTTRKPDGMGLGLHITDEIMKTHGGYIKILEKGDVSLPKEIDGAVIALVFKNERK